MPNGMLYSGAVAELARRKFGGDVASFEIEHTITSGVQELLGGDPERVGVVVVNTSTADHYLGFTPDVSASKGILLKASGGAITLVADEDFELVTRQIFLFGSASGGTIFGEREVRVRKTPDEG